MAIQVGDVFGDYRITGVLGRGGMGKVYRVWNTVTDREEAMKVALADVDEDPALADRFLREIKVHASLLHPNIAALRTALRIEGRLVMIMELVEGTSLEDVLQSGPMPWPRAVSIAAKVLSALAFAHERGVVHRDIKPANILIAADGEVKLTDFGIARPAGGARLTGTGFAVGTLAYMSPEQVRAGEVDGRSDIYSLGLTLYEMVTGKRAIHSESGHELMNAQLNAMPPDPVIFNPQVPAALSAAILRAIQKRPEDRFRAASDFAAALPTASDHPPAMAQSSSPTLPAELAALEARLSRHVGPIARHLVSEAARRCSGIAQIRQALAEHIADPGERAAFLEAGTEATDTMPRNPTPAPAAGAIGPATVDRIVRELAPYLGPIAKVMVARAARTSPTAEDLLRALAAEIDSPEDRKKFLAAARAAI